MLGFAVPVVGRSAGEGPGLAEHFEHRWRPPPASVAVPVFAFFAAGVAIGGASGLGESMRDPVALGILAGLVVGKPLGIVAATYLVARFTRASLDTDLSWWDVLGLATQNAPDLLADRDLVRVSRAFAALVAVSLLAPAVIG